VLLSFYLGSEAREGKERLTDFNLRETRQTPLGSTAKRDSAEVVPHTYKRSYIYIYIYTFIHIFVRVCEQSEKKKGMCVLFAIQYIIMSS